MNKLPTFRALLLIFLAWGLMSTGLALAQSGPWVTTTDYSVFGNVRGFDLATPWTVSSDLATIPGDAVGRHHQGLVYIVGRGGANLIQIYDPAAGFSLVREFSLGDDLNPQDIAFLDDGTAYVSCYDTAVLLRVDLSAGTVLESFSTEAYADSDGLPETSWLQIFAGKLYLTCQLLDRGNYYSPTGPGKLLVFDLANQTWLSPVPLTMANPYTPIRVTQDHSGEPRLAVGCNGYYALLDGGIELVNPDTDLSAGLLINESDLGGDILNFVHAGPDLVFALISSPSFTTSIVRVNTASAAATVIDASSGYTHADLAFDGGFQLLVADRTPGNGGLRVFDVESGVELTSGALSTGLPPFHLIMPEDSAPAPTEEIPAGRLALGQPFPNPCNPTATLSVNGKPNAQVLVTVLDLRGHRLQETPLDLDGAGQAEFVFKGQDENGRTLAAGVYRVVVQGGSSLDARSIVLVK